VIVTFRRHEEQRVSSWMARRGKRTIIPGSTMALGRGDAPHDLLQFAVEAAVGLEYGFWGCVAKGATFRSLGRKRTRPGRAVIAEHRAEVDAAEGVAGFHVAAWKKGEPTPAAEALTRLSAAWDALEDGEPLTVEWPSSKILSPEHAVARK
jgi:hypothetical protein